MQFLHLSEVDSTNNYVATHAGELADMTMVAAEKQTSGRGQRGNSWESEPGKNLTFTLLFKPSGILPREQFAISEATALAIADGLEEFGCHSSVKWPNDIYVGDRKIAGILIEHSVTSENIEHSRIGVGLNVNQTEFKGGAPNPVSLAMLKTKLFDLRSILTVLAENLEKRLKSSLSSEGREALHNEFLGRLWRFDGKTYRFRRRDSEEIFEGRIEGIDPFGPITVKDLSSGTTREYAFKEIEFIL